MMILKFEMSRRSILNEDRISSLPDSIICHILSFLPTKSAATTSVLSKRWNPLWLSVPSLRFDDRTFPNYNSFFRFVSSIFLLRDITLPIRSFHLKCSKASPHQSHDINRFVYAIGQRGIENLNLEIFGFLFFKVKLPPSIFNCRTLVVIRLKGYKMNDLSHVVVNFPLLKTLHLSFLLFKPVQFLLNLLSGCPVLEELKILYLHPDPVPERLILDEKFQCIPNLIKANISDLSSKANALFTLLCRAKFLCVELHDTGYSHFPTFQNLIEMELTLKHEHCEKWKWVIEVLKRCPKLQNLTIHQDSRNENNVMDNWLDPTIVPECLSTQLKTCLLKGCKSMECEVQFAKYIMQNAKVLNTMSIKSASTIGINAKYQMITKIASSTRASATCELLFD